MLSTPSRMPCCSWCSETEVYPLLMKLSKNAAIILRARDPQEIWNPDFASLSFRDMFHDMLVFYSYHIISYVAIITPVGLQRRASMLYTTHHSWPMPSSRPNVCYSWRTWTLRHRFWDGKEFFGAELVDLIGCNHGRLQWRYSYPFSSWEGALGGETISFIQLFYASQKHQVLKHFLKIHVESLGILAVSGAFFLAILKLVQVLRIFIDRLPSLDFLNNRGETPLHYAACPPQMESAIQ